VLGAQPHESSVLAEVGPGYESGGLMLVGEAPGRDEVLRHQPFKGRAGRVLDALLGFVQIDRDACVISNALLCRPPNNKIEDAPRAVESCNNRLVEELWAYRPRVVVGLGNHAMRSLIGAGSAKTERVIQQCGVCGGTGRTTLRTASWLAEKTREKRAKATAEGLDTFVPCKPCSASGTRNARVPHPQLRTDRGIMDLAGAIIDVWNDPAYQHLRGFYPPETRWVIGTYHPSFLMREGSTGSKDKSGKVSGPFFMPWAAHHLRRARRLLTEDPSFAIEPFVLESDAGAAELAEFCRPAVGRVFAIDIETVGPEVAPLDHDWEEHEGVYFCTDCHVTPDSAAAKKPCGGPEGKESPRAPRVDPLLERIQCVGIARSDTDEVCVIDLREPGQQLACALVDFLRDVRCPKLFHNGAFDVAVLETLDAWHISDPFWSGPFQVDGWVGDTNTLALNIWPDTRKPSTAGGEVGVPLDWVVHTYVDARPWKPKKKVKNRPTFASFDELAVYNARDVHGTLNAYYALVDEAEREHVPWALVQNDLAHQLVAIDMQRAGLPVDVARMREIEEECSRDLDESRQTFERLAGRPVNLNAHREIEKVLFDEWHLPVMRSTKTGRSTAFDVLQQLRGQHEGVEALVRAREVGQLLKLYVHGWGRLVRDGRIHPSWRACVTRTGRYSSSPNCQNWPARMRRVVRAPKGWLLVGADYAALEMRIVAGVTGGKIAAFVNKPDDDTRKFDPEYDCHSHVAAMTYGERFTHPARFLDLSGNEDSGALILKIKKEIRDNTKRIVYARNYGSGLDTIYEIVREENPRAIKEEVAATIRAYDAAFPEIPRYRDDQLAHAIQTRCLQSLILGRRRKFPFGDIAPTDAANYPIQSTASDIVNIRMLALLKRLPLSANLIAQVHDSVLVECPENEADTVRALMDETLPCTYDLGGGPMLFDAKAVIRESWDQC
jgi:uracil-DNA glycosylase family 4